MSHMAALELEAFKELESRLITVHLKQSYSAMANAYRT